MKTHCKTCGAPRRRALNACDYCQVEYEPAAAVPYSHEYAEPLPISHPDRQKFFASQLAMQRAMMARAQAVEQLMAQQSSQSRARWGFGGGYGSILGGLI